MKDGELNRKMLRSIIFSDQSQKEWLEELLHPPIIAEIIARSNDAKSPYCVVVIPLLIENNLQHLFNNILVVTSTPAQQSSRVTQRDQIDNELFESIKSSQFNEHELLKHADEIINNDGSKENLRNQVEKLHSKYLRTATKLEL